MHEELQKIKNGAARNYESPPLHLWHPELSGDIDILIDRGGSWFHEGTKIEREAIVRLFASILRRENDGEYYLVTPGEKWRISVEILPLVVIDIEREHSDNAAQLRATLNTGKQVDVNKDNYLYLVPECDDVAALALPHGLGALFNRAAWYRLIEMSEPIDGHTCVRSGNEVYQLDR